VPLSFLAFPFFPSGCTGWTGNFSSKEGQRFEWVDAEKLPTVPMPAADIPLLPAVLHAMKMQAEAPGA